MAEVASPGHKLGQMVGNLFQELFTEDLVNFCQQYGYYCDHQGPRPKVRGRSKKVSWKDKEGNNHDLDFVVEKGGSSERRGAPVAFIELAWRRYTRHSRAKTGELEGSLLHLRQSYPSCRFLGAIIAGEYSEGGKQQLISHGVNVVHVPFEAVANSFKTQGVNLAYPDKAPARQKRSVILKWQALGQGDTEEVKARLQRAIAADYAAFKKGLERALLRKVDVVRILPLYGKELVFSSLSDAISALTGFQDPADNAPAFVRFEVQIRYTNGDRGEETFQAKDDAVRYLQTLS